MSDVIKLLPDSVANQIAAGEVIQRPASAVKELLENAIDAGATSISLMIKDAGRTLIQVTDNGNGMTETDARMCFERHATSKIKEASDLFSISTMGFRGEAMASIAAISRVELKTRTPGAAMGTEVIIEGSKIESQRSCQCPVGTTIVVKNLFFNTPARRNFLKSDSVEKGHIYTELTRVALAYPGVAFKYFQNGHLTHQYDKGNQKQRIANVFGNGYSLRLVPVEEKTELLTLTGYVLKPEFSKKSRGEQFFFVNNRFIKSTYFTHAVNQAFEELIPIDSFASFFLFLQTDPGQIDVNVHPTKTEIKFQDERYFYQLLKSSVKRALSKYNISPTLDFDREQAFDNIPPPGDRPIQMPTISLNPDYNPFQPVSGSGSSTRTLTSRANPARWENLFPKDEDLPIIGKEGMQPKLATLLSDMDDERQIAAHKKPMQLQQRYIIIPVKSGLMVIDQQRAHERIIFERLNSYLENKKSASQNLLYPENIKLSDSDSVILKGLLKEMELLGFSISTIGKNTFVVSATPTEIPDGESLQPLVEGMIESFKLNQVEMKLDVGVNVSRSLARRLAIKHGKWLAEEEMISLVDQLFACTMPYQSPSGKPTLSILALSEISNRFK